MLQEASGPNESTEAFSVDGDVVAAEQRAIGEQQWKELQSQLRSTFRTLTDGGNQLDADSLRKFYFLQRPYKNFNKQRAIDEFIRATELNPESPITVDEFVDGVVSLMLRLEKPSIQRHEMKEKIVDEAMEIVRSKTRSELIQLLGLPVDVSDEEISMILDED